LLHCFSALLFCTVFLALSFWHCLSGTVFLDNEAQAGKRLGFNERNAGRAAPDLLDVVVKPGKLPGQPQRVVHYSTVVTGVSTILTNQF
jgi:hypothetical protein